MTDPAPRMRRNPQAAWRELDGQVMIVTPQDAMLHLLNSVGSFVWKQLDAPRSPADLAAAVCCEFDVDQDTALRDVEEFLALMRDKNMLETC